MYTMWAADQLCRWWTASLLETWPINLLHSACSVQVMEVVLEVGAHRNSSAETQQELRNDSQNL